LTDRQDLRNAYDVWHCEVGEPAERRAPWHDLVLAHLGGLVEGADLLEIGCGDGSFAVELASRGAKSVVAADFSPVAVELAGRVAKQSGEAIETRVADVQDLSDFRGRFDIVVSCETIEHVPNPSVAVEQLANALKPGGRLFLTTPNYAGLLGIHRAYRRARGKPTDECGQPWNNVTLLPRTAVWVRRAGLAIDAVDGCGHYVPLPGRQGGPKRLSLPGWVARPARFIAAHSLIVAHRPVRQRADAE
jgi:SAM-dependent methyltransferase